LRPVTGIALPFTCTLFDHPVSKKKNLSVASFPQPRDHTILDRVLLFVSSSHSFTAHCQIYIRASETFSKTLTLMKADAMLAKTEN
jgi:hypothetical protein